jgi:hypothetical protein
MKKFFANDGEEIDEPGPVMLAQSFRERIGLDKAVPVVAGPLSEEFRTILSEPSGLSASEFHFSVVSGGGLREAYQRAAAASPSSTAFQKIFGGGALNKKTPFFKVDEQKREVWGYVTAEVPDKDDEICDYEKSLPYYRAWVAEFQKSTDGASYGNLREMHQLSAVGKGIAFDPRDGEKAIFMGFKIIDNAAWEKVMTRVYTGFSHGGEVVGPKVPDPVHKNCMRYVAKPVEISLVDNPCLGSATYTLVRANGKQEIVKIAA